MSYNAEERARLRAMSSVELQQALLEARDELFQNRLRYANMILDNAEPLRKGRKKISRILTYIRQHELSGS